MSRGVAGVQRDRPCEKVPGFTISRAAPLREAFSSVQEKIVSRKVFGRLRQRTLLLTSTHADADILADLGSKLVEVAREMNRPREIVDYLWHSEWPDGLNRYQDNQQAAAAAGVKLESKAIADAMEIEEAIIALKEGGASTLIVQPSPLTFQQRAQIIATATRYGIGTIWAFPAAARGRNDRVWTGLHPHVSESPALCGAGDQGH